MFQGSELPRLVALLDERRVVLFHACQLRDFKSCLELGGIPSRERMQESRLDFTRFETDERDQANEVWDKVFFNLHDFGRTFANGHVAVPNTFGPIVMRVNPEALSDSTDVAICLRSAGAQGFDRGRESLKTCDDVDRLFVNPSDAEEGKRGWVKFAKDLQAEFSSPHARDPEISCTFPNGLAPLEHVRSVIVDPYQVEATTLMDTVNRLRDDSSHFFHTYERNGKPNNDRYHALAQLIGQGGVSFADAQKRAEGSGLEAWLKSLEQANLGYQYDRFARYLALGTFDVLASGS